MAAVTDSTEANSPDAERWQGVGSDLARDQARGPEGRGARRISCSRVVCREVCVAEVVDLNGVITEIERLLHRTIGEHVRPGHEPRHRLARGPLADPGQMEQILVNLAVNEMLRDARRGFAHHRDEQPRCQRGVRLDPAAGHAGPVRPSACQ